MNDITEILTDKKYFTLIKKLEEQLSRRFDLTNPKEMEEYSELISLRTKAITEIILNANNPDNFSQNDNLRSVILGIDSGKELKSFSSESFIEAFKQIRVQDTKNNSNDSSVSVLYAFSTDNIPKEIRKRYS